MNELVKLNKARQALMEAKTLNEIKEIKDIAKAVKAYAQAKKLGVEMVNDATEIELRAEREMGKLIQQKQEAGELAKESDNQFTVVVTEGDHHKSTLSEIGISKKESSTSKRLAAIPEDKFEQKINELKSEKKPLTKTGFLNEIKIQERKEKIEILKKEIPKISELKNTYDVIVIDPPWAYEEKGGLSYDDYNPEATRGLTPYPTMTVSQIKQIKLPLSENAIVFLWTTHAFLRDAFDILESWNLKYKATIVWDKEIMGMGRTIRMQCEFCLMAFCGNPIFNGAAERDILRVKRRQHSRKPDEFYEFVERACIGRKLDYFAREKRKNWDVYGIETEKF